MIDDIPRHWEIFQKISEPVKWSSSFNGSHVIEAYEAVCQLRNLAMLAQRGELTMNQLAYHAEDIHKNLKRILNCDYPLTFQCIEFPKFPCAKEVYPKRELPGVKAKKSRKVTMK